MLLDKEIGPLLLECLQLGLLGQVPIASLPLQMLGVLRVEAQVFVEGDACVLQERVLAGAVTFPLYLLTLTKQAV